MGNLGPLRLVGQIDTSRLESIDWPAAEQMIRAARAVDSRWQGSQLVSRSFDEAQPGGHRVAFQVHGLLKVAEENLRAFRSLISTFGVHHWAHWNLLRPNLEASLWVLWVLAPAEARDRVRRALRLEVADVREHLKWMRSLESAGLPKEAMDHVWETHSRNQKVYETEAEQLRIGWKQVTTTIQLTNEIPTLHYGTDDDQAFGHYVCSVWRRLSGSQHAKGYSLVARADISHRIPIPGGESVFLTVNDEDFISTTSLVNAVHLIALQRYLDWTSMAQMPS